MALIILPNTFAIFESTVLAVNEFTVTKDWTWTPYVQGQLVLPLTMPVPVLSALVDIDIELGKRIQVLTLRGTNTEAKIADVYPEGALSALTAAYDSIAEITGALTEPLGGTATPSAKSYDLLVRSVDVDYAAGTVTVQLASDEAAASDWEWADAERFYPPMVPTTSVLDYNLVQWEPIVNAVLARVGIYNVNARVPRVPYDIPPTVFAASAAEVMWPDGMDAWSYLESLKVEEFWRLACDENRHWAFLAVSDPHPVQAEPTTLSGFEKLNVTRDPDSDVATSATVKQTYRQTVSGGEAVFTSYSQPRAATENTPYPRGRKPRLFEDDIPGVLATDDTLHRPGDVYGPPDAYFKSIEMAGRYGARRAVKLTATGYDWPHVEPGLWIADPTGIIAADGHTDLHSGWLVDSVTYIASASRYEISASLI